MKAHLMYRERDFDLSRPGPPQQDAVVQDLELVTLLSAMGGGDNDLTNIARKAVLASSADVSTILYRQDILRDCLRHEQIVRDVYNLAVETLDAERKNYLGMASRYPQWVLHRSVEVMEMLVGKLQQLRAMADQHIGSFASEGFKTMFTMLQRELDDDYFALVRRHLMQLKFQRGTLISARLGQGNKGIDYVLRAQNPPEGNWLQRMLSSGPPGYSFTLPERDESGARALSELRDRGINLVANAVAQSVDHIVSFFNMLRIELAFYVGCLNLHTALAQRKEPVCFPVPSEVGNRARRATGLYDVCLALTMDREVVGNDLKANGKNLVIITGANQGGKSTFLRSVGLAQLMMQCGMFVPAHEFRANLCERIFTHYKREEDAAMESGKFDEELQRMSCIVDHLVPNALVLFNESFAATNEREGSEIARQIATALTDRGVEVFFVSHHYEFARSFHAQHRSDVLFLRAERQPDGTRTFKLTEAPPLPTSFGQDLYRRIFETEPAA
jgi:DNA mismatch repair ATPase MutS